MHQPQCTSADLVITAQPGSGAMQQQYATIRLANHSAGGCWLVGYPTVTLLAGGHVLGHPAAPLHTGAPAFFVAAGRAATAALHGPSTCNEGVSDSVRVSAPSQTAHADVALLMRGCRLVVDPFQRS